MEENSYECRVYESVDDRCLTEFEWLGVQKRLI